jgi:diphthine synthase
VSRLTFVGLGLFSESGITLEGLEEARGATHVFAEFYTSHMAGIDLLNLERIIDKHVEILSRKDVEEKAEMKILAHAKSHPCVLLTPGDPNVATTHIDLRLRAEKAGIRTSIIHAASVSSAIAGATGLQSYKFGRTVTIPFESTSTSDAPYENICENKARGLHTLALLDIDSEKERYMTIPEGLSQLLGIEDRRSQGCVALTTLAIGVSRLGSREARIKAETVEGLLEYDWGGPPHSLVFPGKLHFMEIEALEVLFRARRGLFEGQT